MTQPSPRHRFDDFLRPMIGRPAWSVRRGSGTFLTLEFGDPVAPRGRPHHDDETAPRPHGQWHLWIYCCDWQIREGEALLAGSSSDLVAIGAALARLEGRDLTGFDVEPAKGGARFRFADGLTLSTRPYAAVSIEEQWFVYAGNLILSYRADGRFSIIEGDTPPGAETWECLA